MSKFSRLKIENSEQILLILFLAPIVCCLCTLAYGMISFYIHYTSANQAFIDCLNKNIHNPEACEEEFEYLLWLPETYEPLIIHPIIMIFIWFMVFGGLFVFLSSSKGIRRSL